MSNAQKLFMLIRRANDIKAIKCRKIHLNGCVHGIRYTRSSINYRIDDSEVHNTRRERGVR